MDECRIWGLLGVGRRGYSPYPVKWSIISVGTIGFWSQCIILLGYHFTGARSYFLPVYHFTETSFYRNNFVKVSVSFLSVSFYSSTLKIWTLCIILQVHFGYIGTNKIRCFFSPNPLAADGTCGFHCDRHYSTTSIKFSNSNQKLHVHIFLSREWLKYHQPTLWVPTHEPFTLGLTHTVQNSSLLTNGGVQVHWLNLGC